jgi:hypothetical protein
VRDKLAALLAPILDTDPNVLSSLVDTIEPPALMLGWGEPWEEPDTSCFRRGRVIVTCVGSRLVPGEGLAMVETLVDYTHNHVEHVDPTFLFELTTGPRVFQMGNTKYLAARMLYGVMLDG